MPSYKRKDKNLVHLMKLIVLPLLPFKKEQWLEERLKGMENDKYIEITGRVGGKTKRLRLYRREREGNRFLVSLRSLPDKNGYEKLYFNSPIVF